MIFRTIRVNSEGQSGPQFSTRMS